MKRVQHVLQGAIRDGGQALNGIRLYRETVRQQRLAKSSDPVLHGRCNAQIGNKKELPSAAMEKMLCGQAARAPVVNAHQIVATRLRKWKHST